jgi:nucleotide-binding universal stress UspA family protein
MRLMLATDGSPSSMLAADLIGSSRWGPGTTVDVVAVVDDAAVLPSPFATFPANAQSLDDALVQHCTAVADEVAELLRALGMQVTATVLHGRPIDRLVQRAVSTGAELVVCGSRGLGEFRSLLLGSVSAGLVDHAPCPVLVGRSRRITRTLLADDGSPAAIAAERVVATWPLFNRVPVEVLTVASVHPGLRSPFGMLPVGVALAQYDVATHAARQRARELNDAAVARLAKGGRSARPVVREGDATSLVLSQAQSGQDDLIVIGTHRYHTLDRLVLGSVSRAVLMHAPVSVLVTRPALRADDSSDAQPVAAEADPTSLVAV